MTPTPPVWMTKFLRWYCRRDLVDGIEGDLFELYERRLNKYGKFRANTLYLFNILLFFQPFALKKRNRNRRLNSIDMFRNYLTIAVRSLMKTKSISAINIIGLAIGIASFIIMTAYVFSELSFDKFHSKAERIVRTVYSYEARGSTTGVARVVFPLKYRLLENYPEVEKVVRFHEDNNDAITLEYRDKLFTEEKIFFTDPEIFDVFDFPFVAGDPGKALTSRNSIVMTEEAAKRYFGSENPIGKTILFKNEDQLLVTGILEKSTHSQIDFDFLVPLELQRYRWLKENSNDDLEKNWRWSGAWTYVLLKSAELKTSFDERFHEDGVDFFGRISDPPVDYHYTSQSLLDVHLKSNLAAEIGVNGTVSQVYGFAITAFLILIIACLNFINLTTAQSTSRAKEIGLRKVMGAHRINLIWQFITESILVTILSTVLSLLLIEVMMPIFNSFMDQNITIPYFQLPILILLFFLGAIVVGGLAGSYPSFYLSKLKPIKTLKGDTQAGGGNSNLRKTFVIGQFIVSNILIIGIIVVQLQMNLVKGKNLGFDKNQTIILEHGSKMENEFQLFKSKLSNIPSIAGINQGYVAGTPGWVQSFRVEGEDLEAAKSIGINHIGYDFLDFFGLEMVSGRFFSKEFSTDSTKAVLINEAAVRALGWTNETALGKTFTTSRWETKVIGVMRDANFESLYKPIKPNVFKLSFFGDVAIKFETENHDQLVAALGAVEDAWMELFPQWPFEFTFLDQQIEDQYLKDERLGQMIQFFALLAIFIACMGLFGLATFTVKKRTKEIGVRKVLGAGIWNIVAVIMKGFLVLVLVSFIISVPAGYYISENWLQDFAYRIELGPLIFLFSGVISTIVAGLAILSQSLYAARLDPVSTLKYE